MPGLAGRVYELVDYPAHQNGATLRGTITVNEVAFAAAALREEPLELTFSSIDAFEFTVTSSDGQAFSASGVGLAFPGSGVTPGTVLATKDQITLGLGRGLSQNVAAFVLAEELWDENYEYVEKYVALTYFLNGNSGVNRYSVGGTDGPLQGLIWNLDPGIDGLGGEPWVIARFVPEPGTIMLIAAGLATLGLTCRFRRLQER